MEVIID